MNKSVEHHVAMEGAAGCADFDRAALLRPHFTPSTSPSISRPFAHACAAVSADVRSTKLTNAHLDVQNELSYVVIESNRRKTHTLISRRARQTSIARVALKEVTGAPVYERFAHSHLQVAM